MHSLFGGLLVTPQVHALDMVEVGKVPSSSQKVFVRVAEVEGRWVGHFLFYGRLGEIENRSFCLLMLGKIPFELVSMPEA